MLALQEFVNFMTHHKANLAESYTQLLKAPGHGYENFPHDSCLTAARKLLNAMIASYESETITPLASFFNPQHEKSTQRWPAELTPPQPYFELECLGQTLTPIVTNLEAGKFLWQTLAEVRMLVTPLVNDEHSHETTATSNISPQQERLTVELADSQNADRFRLLSTAAFEGIVFTDQGKVIDANEQFAQIYGYDVAEVAGLDAWNFVAPESVELVKQYIAAGREDPYEAVQQRKDGSTFWAQISGKSITYQGKCGQGNLSSRYYPA